MTGSPGATFAAPCAGVSVITAGFGAEAAALLCCEPPGAPPGDGDSLDGVLLHAASVNPATTATNPTRDRPVAPQTLMHTARFAWYQPQRLAIVCLTGPYARGRMAEYAQARR
ncbi:hypothetical protein AVL48_34685 [Amycolatopsis regifaucium]|uniref:Uncharacterized protein n=1 Tax=Amycolatopsis regifaucium TaxID=546365 RepID=A0A154MK02_9PSEU|nr:hypothetical protein AVL48_34685 [Amycolatopsis regifaucium]